MIRTTTEKVKRGDESLQFSSLQFSSVSTNFRLILIEPSARDDVGQQFFRALTLFRVSVGLSHLLFYSLHSPPRSSLWIKVQKNLYFLASAALLAGENEWTRCITSMHCMHNYALI